MPNLIQANTASEPRAVEIAADICDDIVTNRVPNFFRLHLSPHVTEACYCLTRLVDTTFGGTAEPYQVFLANSFEESLSGALKLCRYASRFKQRSATGLLVDPDRRLDHFASTTIAGTGDVTYLPQVHRISELSQANDWLTRNRPGCIFIDSTTGALSDDAFSGTINRLRESDDAPLLIVRFDSDSLTAGRINLRQSPDVVIFDESFVEHAVPFAAFAASKQLFNLWNRRGMTSFHSTTFQPNAISSMAVLRCLREKFPAFMVQMTDVADRIRHDLDFRSIVYADCYSPGLARLISLVDLDQSDVRADGHYVTAGKQRIFDGVGGVACSLRGHNPPQYPDELRLRHPTDSDDRADATQRIHQLSALPNLTPAVSGAAAVEHALKIALVSQFPKQFVVAFEGGFGGKTMFSLTGTAKRSLKVGLDPLYQHVIYMDPFAHDACETLSHLVDSYPVAAVQLELIQGVGGVRPIPEDLIRHLQHIRQRNGCLLIVDEVQTGMFRTGPFLRSLDLELIPDIVTIGKGASDMMFPFAATLYSAEIQDRLDSANCDLTQVIKSRFGYASGYRTLRNALDFCDRHQIEQRVRERGSQFSNLLEPLIASDGVVADVRCFGLLIGIEIDSRWRSPGWLKRLLSRISALQMLKHARFPLLCGFCQHAPHVLKLTPPLSISEQEVHQICESMTSVLGQPMSRLTAAFAKATVADRLRSFRSASHQSLER